jgi:hypothetical protein
MTFLPVVLVIGDRKAGTPYRVLMDSTQALETASLSGFVVKSG